MGINQQRLMQSLEEMWQIGATPNGGVTRLALTDEDRAARDLLGSWFEHAGLAIRIDDFGNQIGRRAGRQDLPPVVMGSHADTVPMGGRYDGILGILSALEVVRTLNDEGIETEHPIEIVNWTGEEGSRFQRPLFGSVGAFNETDTETALSSTDDAGMRFIDELNRIGYNGDKANRPADAHAYLELHIEQGPILEDANLPVGLVLGVIAQTWHGVTVRGRAGHAGANPMNLRADALVAAAQMIQDVRQLALAAKGYGVATVGKLSLLPNATNIVPAEVRFSVDARAAMPEDLVAIEAGLYESAQLVEQREGVTVEIEGDSLAVTTPFDVKVVEAIRQGMVREGLTVHELWSGAGHDAQVAALHWPAGMIFVRSKDGLSHAEAEYSSPEDIEAGTNVLLHAAVELANQTEPHQTA